MPEQALFDPNEAARYLGVSRRYFDDHVRPLVPIVDMKPPKSKQPMWRFRRADLDKLIDARTRAKLSA